MKDWNNYVGCQELTPEAGTFDTRKLTVCGTDTYTDWGVCKYLAYKQNWQGQLSLALEQDEFHIDQVLNETEDTIGDAVEQALLTSFPEIIIANETQLQEAKCQVARDTRRGITNKHFSNIWWYQGQGGATTPRPENTIMVENTDQPIIVVKYQGKYGIWKHPNFAQYGFAVI